MRVVIQTGVVVIGVFFVMCGSARNHMTVDHGVVVLGMNVGSRQQADRCHGASRQQANEARVQEQLHRISSMSPRRPRSQFRRRAPDWNARVEGGLA